MELLVTRDLVKSFGAFHAVDGVDFTVKEREVLAQLEDEGLVRLEERDGRRTYVLSDAGRAYLEERRDDLVAPWEEMSESVDDDVAALFKEMRQVAMAAAQIGHMGSAHQITEARGVLANARRALYSLLAEDEPHA